MEEASRTSPRAAKKDSQSNRVSSALTRIENLLTELQATIERKADKSPKVDHLLSMSEAASVLGISRRSLHDLLSLGHLRATRIGRRRLISSRLLEAFIRSRTAKQ